MQIKSNGQEQEGYLYDLWARFGRWHLHHWRCCQGAYTDKVSRCWTNTEAVAAERRR